MPEIVYVLVNEAMPGLVKIGLTETDLDARLAQLNCNSAVPLPFECYFAAEVDSCVRIERVLHQLFSDSRINPRREFFRIDPEKVVLAISIGSFREVTPGAVMADADDRDALEKEKARRPRINLSALGIYPGSVLTFSRDSAVTAEVVEGNRVRFRDEVKSLSASALEALRSLGYRTPSASGSEYWAFEDELLDVRRRRMEAEKFDAAQE